MIAGLTATHDVSGTHDGYLLTGQLGVRAPILPLLASTVVVSSTYANGDYMDTYFGIGAGDSLASGLDEFDADAGFKDVGVTLNLQHGRRNEGWGLTGIFSYKRLLDDAADSPIVDDVGDANQLFGGAAITYSF
jgi:outer membrane protein